MQDKYVNPFTDFGFKKLFGEELFEAAQIACFTPMERQAYEDSLKYYRALKNVTDTAREEGWDEGREAGKLLEKQAIARNLLQRDLIPEAEIASITGLSLENIRQLRATLDGEPQP